MDFSYTNYEPYLTMIPLIGAFATQRMFTTDYRSFCIGMFNAGRTTDVGFRIRYVNYFGMQMAGKEFRSSPCMLRLFLGLVRALVTKWRLFGCESDLCRNRGAGKHKWCMLSCFHAILLSYVVLIPARMSGEGNLKI